jgi:hypothetical protein
MKNLMTFSLALTLVLSSVAMAQYGTQPNSGKSDAAMKSVNVSGQISDDGKTFVTDKDGKTWTINNADAVKGHEGHHVTLKANVDADKNEVHVLSLKMAKDKMGKDAMQK